LSNFDLLLSQSLTKFFRVLPSILSKYQFHFDQLWANISSILTNFDQGLNYWGCYTPPPPPPPHTHTHTYSDVPEKDKSHIFHTEVNFYFMQRGAMFVLF
jgi:hypothetical protein